MKAAILLSKTFFKNHYRACDQTDFAQKVLSCYKIHTIRKNYYYWKDKIDRIKEQVGFISIRQWADMPYKSKQDTIIDIPAEKKSTELTTDSNATILEFSIIHFTPFRY